MENAITLSSLGTLTQRDRACLWHPFTQMLHARDPIPIVKAEGAYLYAEDGTRYIDAISSWWVNLHGHAHPYIAAKVQEQVQTLEHVIFADFTHAPAVELAERLLQLLPGGMAKLFYSDNGSTAVEVALKIALQYWHNQHLQTQKRKVICFNQGYHGDTFGAMAVGGKNLFNRPFWSYLFEVEAIDPPLQGKIDRSVGQLKAILQTGEAACFIFEPLVLGAGGMIFYPAEGLDALLAVCREHQVITIADEVMTGFGRTGSLFACDILQEKPDILCLSKGITGGFLPLGATTCKAFIYEAFLSKDPYKAFLHGHSFTANPLACCAGLASLDLLEAEQCAQQRWTIAECHQNFCAAWKGHSRLKRCESLGTILALEYVSPEREFFQTLRDRLYGYFLDQRILLRPLGNVVYLLPPYCITSEELQHIYAHILISLEEL